MATVENNELFQYIWNNNEVFLRATNHTGQAEKNLLGPAGIRTRDLRFYQSDALPTELQVRTGKTEGRGFESQPGQVDFSLLVRYGSSLGETPHYYSLPEFTVP